MPYLVNGFMSDALDSDLRPWQFERRDLREDDLLVDVTFCGVCHSDLHALHSERGEGDAARLVPGHEFVGTVAEIGTAVTGFAVGDAVAVGNIVDSCGVCEMCVRGQENYCVEFPTTTYGGVDRQDGTTTYGAYSSQYVVREKFAYHLPANLDPAAAAPLMCAGITVWEPLVRWGVGPGMKVGIVGLGGLGHLAVKFAHALGAEVTLFTTSAGKANQARELGAAHVIVSSDEEDMAAHANTFAFILDAVAVPHDLTPYLRTLDLDGTLCSVGVLGSMEFDPMRLLIGRKSVASAGSGGTVETQRMLDFAGEHGIEAETEVLPARDVNVALDRLARNDVRFRFSLDMKQL